MKTRLLSLLLLIFVCSIYTSYAQSNVKTIPLAYEGGLPPDKKLSPRINDNLFLIYRQPFKGKAAFEGYNTKLEKVFTIDVEIDYLPGIMAPTRNGIFPYITYNKSKDQLLIIEMDFARPGFNSNTGFAFRAKTYDTTGKLIKKESFTLPSKGSNFDKVEIAEDGSHFAIFLNTGKKKRDLSVTTYNFDLQQLYTKVIPAREEETFEARGVTSQGNIVLVSSINDTQLEFNRYNAKGTLDRTLKAKKNISGKAKYDSYLIQLQGERMVVAAEKSFGSDFMGIHVFDANLETKQLKDYQSIEFSAANVASLYDKLPLETVLNKNYGLNTQNFQKPKYLEHIQLQHLLLDNDNIYVISESLYFKTTTTGKRTYTTYYANDILVSSFSESKNNWNTIIGRRMQHSLGDVEWTGLKSTPELYKGKLKLVTSEYQRSTNDVSSFLRTIDLTSGSVTPPQRLFAEGAYSLTPFIGWLTPTQLYMIKVEYEAFRASMNLSLIQTESRTVQ